MTAVAEKKKRKTERQRDAERKRIARKSDRDLTIPRVVNPRRKKKAEADIFTWLPTYFPEAFYHPFTEQQKEMVRDILFAAKYGGDKAIAAPRSDGKTTIAECVILFCVMTGLLKFPLIAAATGPDAARILDHIKAHLERNDTLAGDYPEVCYPIRALEGAPQRAGSQTVGGKRTWLEWKQDYVVLPTVKVGRKKSRASGAVILTRGLDAAIRGIRVGTTRPDFVLIDDPETRESVKSEEQTKSRRLTIEQDLAGLGGGDKKLSRVILTTIMRRTTDEGNPTISFEYTDPKQKHSWQGLRQKLLVKMPELWEKAEEYIAMRQTDFQTGDPHARKSHQWYIENRPLLEHGAEVSNENRYSTAILPDGSQAEVSALQRCLNIIADRGMEAFLTEYQNDPPEQSGPVESGITAHRIQRQVSGYARKVIPPGCIVLTRGIDVRKIALHWVVRAWMPNGTGYTIDYGVHEVLGTVYGSDEGLELAVRRAILGYLESSRDEYHTTGGEVMPIDLTLVDAGWETNTIYSTCLEAGDGVMPIMGFGKSSGCTQANFTEIQHKTVDKEPGDGWFHSRKSIPVADPETGFPRKHSFWLVCADTDRWKKWEHARWMTAPGKPGAMSIFGTTNHQHPDRLSDDEKAHHSYSRHIVNEIEIEEPYKGTTRRRFKAKSENTHWLDASYYADVAANKCGIKLMSSVPTIMAKPKLKLSEIYAAKHGAKR